MSMPFYVPPEQQMKDRADFARKGIARGRSIVGCQFDNGILLVAENPSSTLRKISEIYDRIGFAGVGKYNEFDQLRQAGIRAADIKGYQFSRADVDAQSLANSYAQIMAQVFTHDAKPLEVEILVAEVGYTSDGDRLFHLLYDGTIIDEATGYSALGGDSEAIVARWKESYTPGADLSAALKSAVSVLAGPERTLQAGDLEVAILERCDRRRCFKRLSDDEVIELLT